MSEAIAPIAVEDDTEMGVSRVEAFSDGVFSVAITLLVLNLQVPHFATGQNNVPNILNFLSGQWGVYASYFITFLSIGSVWIGHHQAFKLIAKVDAAFQLGNVLFLLLITLLPFTTALLAEYLQPHSLPGTQTTDPNYSSLVQLGIIAYSIHWIILGTVMVGLWRYIRRSGLLKPHADPARIRSVTRQFGLSGLIFGAVGLISAILVPTLSIFFYLAVTLYYMLPLIGLFRPEKGKTIAPR